MRKASHPTPIMIESDILQCKPGDSVISSSSFIIIDSFDCKLSTIIKDIKSVFKWVFLKYYILINAIEK